MCVRLSVASSEYLLLPPRSAMSKDNEVEQGSTGDGWIVLRFWSKKQLPSSNVQFPRMEWSKTVPHSSSFEDEVLVR